jgi:hypothetical protein
VASQKALALCFFSNFIPKAPSLSTTTSSRSTNLSNMVSLDLCEVNYPEATDAPILSPMIIDIIDDDQAETPALLNEPSSLLIQLQSALKAIPTSICYGAPGNAFAQFSDDPIHKVPGSDPDAVWEHINKTMDWVLGYSISAEELLKLVHWRPLGMDGLCSWMETCIKNYGLNLSYSRAVYSG